MKPSQTLFSLALAVTLPFPAALEGLPTSSLQAPILPDHAAELSVAQLQKDIPELMKEAEIPGLSIAIIRNGNTYWLKSFGVRNAKTKERQLCWLRRQRKTVPRL